MIITLIIFCTVVTGIAGMENLKKVGRVGGMALLYFEVVSTLALLIGLVVGNVVHPGSGFNVNVATLDAKSVTDYAGQARAQTVTAHHSNHGIRRLRQRGHLAGGPHRNLVWLRSRQRRTALKATG
jgi:Na+/H+-dicarboxylate symporter